MCLNPEVYSPKKILEFLEDLPRVTYIKSVTTVSLPTGVDRHDLQPQEGKSTI